MCRIEQQEGLIDDKESLIDDKESLIDDKEGLIYHKGEFMRFRIRCGMRSVV